MKNSNFAIAALLFAAPLLAQANAITTYSDLATFSSALGATPTTVETFTNSLHYPISSGVLNSMTNEAGITPGMIQSGITYSTPVGINEFFNIDCCAPTGYFLDSVYGRYPLTVTFDNNAQAFAFDSGYFVNGLDVTINFASGPAYHGSFLTENKRALYGFISSSADIQSVIIGGSTNMFTFAVDNFRFTNSVPEPEISAMLLVGLSLLGVVARRGKKLDRLSQMAKVL